MTEVIVWNMAPGGQFTGGSRATIPVRTNEMSWAAFVVQGQQRLGLTRVDRVLDKDFCEVEDFSEVFASPGPHVLCLEGPVDPAAAAAAAAGAGLDLNGGASAAAGVAQPQAASDVPAWRGMVWCMAWHGMV